VFRIRPRIKDLAPLFVIAAGYLACRMTFLHSVSFYNYPADILFQRVPGFFVAIADYLSLLVFPFNLHMEYSYRIFAFTEPKAIMGMIIASLMMIYAFVKKDKNPLISFSIFWFFLALLPVSNIYPINASYMKEHWLYFPAAGLLVIPAYCLSLLYRKSRWVALPFIVALLAIYCCLTIKQNDYWKEPITFYKKTAECNPRSWKAYNALGLEYMAIGDYAKALDAYQMAINSIPHAAKADTAEWIAYQASEDSARRLVAQNLTSAYRAMEEEMALAEKRGTKGVFLLANRYYEEGNECMVLGRVKEAVAYYNAALRLDPRNPLVSDALGRAYFVSARYKEAIAVFNKMLEIDPGLAAAHNNLAVAYYMEKDYDQAIKHCDEAVSMGYQVEDKLLGWLKPYRK
jgi:tetratricopeptide (TPR) repeat protein